MVIWPKSVSFNDPDWRRACALLQVLPLDTRKNGLPDYPYRNFYEHADNFLVRPFIWVEQKQVPAPYYIYNLKFAVVGSVQGRIEVCSAEELNEFLVKVNAALAGPFCKAERKKWEIDSLRLKLEYARARKETTLQLENGESVDTLNVAILLDQARFASDAALKSYYAARDSLNASWGPTKIAQTGRRPNHDEIMEELVASGLEMIRRTNANELETAT